jgi:hypothetical protein
MRSTILMITLLIASTQAFAHDSEDRVMIMAKRVAAMENSRDLPSRAVWLSNRVIRNSRDLAYIPSKASNKKGGKRPQTIKN